VKVAHILRKYQPKEWGGTETAVKQLLDGLAPLNVESIVFCPRIQETVSSDPIREAGHAVKRFRAFIPVARISPEQRRQLIALGGNLMSFHLFARLLREPDLALIHTHALNRLGGIGLTVAKIRRLPLAVTIHGGVLDLPTEARDALLKPLEGGIEWGKIFGILLRSRQLLAKADAIITCNRKEASLLENKYPGKRILVQPHGVPARRFEADCRPAALLAYPELRGRPVLLMAGRLDPVKNQSWVIQHLPQIRQRHPEALLVIAGACTDPGYGDSIRRQIESLQLQKHVLLTGGIPPGDPKFIGLLQSADILLLPSHSETFGLVILEAWAAGTPVISTRTSGACELVKPGENGWLFDLDDPASFHQALDQTLANRPLQTALAQSGRDLVRRRYDSDALAARVKTLYERIIEEKRK
jgi:alpha-maltose-1-phosphate synthase